MLHQPNKIVITEANPFSVDSYRLQAFNQPLTVLYNDVIFPSDPSGVTEYLIGSNGFLDPVPPNEFFIMKLQQLKESFTGPVQTIPGGPFQNILLPDGAETIVVENE